MQAKHQSVVFLDGFTKEPIEGESDEAAANDKKFEYLYDPRNQKQQNHQFAWEGLPDSTTVEVTRTVCKAPS